MKMFLWPKVVSFSIVYRLVFTVIVVVGAVAAAAHTLNGNFPLELVDWSNLSNPNIEFIMRKCRRMGQRRFRMGEKSECDKMQIVPIGLLIWFGRLWRFHGSLFASQKKTSRNWILLQHYLFVYKSRLSGICLNSCNQNAMKWKFTLCYKSHLLRLHGHVCLCVWRWVRLVCTNAMPFELHNLEHPQHPNRRDGNMDSNSENSLISFNFAHHRCHLSV